MRVLFLPDHTDGNPYQRKLAAGLEEQSVDVTIGSGYPLSTARTILQSPPDVVHVHWVAPFLVTERLVTSIVQSLLFLQATIVAKLLGVKVVWTVHNLSDHENMYPGLERTARVIFARLTDAIIVHCSAAGAQVEREYRLDDGEKMHVIPHGHYDDSYENDIDQETARAELEIPSDETVFLYFGQVRPYKQVPALVETFSDIDDPSLRLVVAGKPTDEDESRRVAIASEGDPRIRTDLEFIPDDRIQLYFNAADAVVLPYRDILTSGSAILAMTFGRPVVGPTVGCLPGLLDQQSELLYEEGAETLSDILRRARTADLATIGDQNRREVTEYDWDEIAAETRRVYEAA